MDLNEYQKGTAETAIYDKSVMHTLALRTQERLRQVLHINYTVGKLNGEAGELMEHACKMIRDDYGLLTEERRDAMIKELGDVLWYVSEIASCLQISLDEVASMNLRKLKARKEQGRIQGSGSDR